MQPNQRISFPIFAVLAGALAILPGQQCRAETVTIAPDPTTPWVITWGASNTAYDSVTVKYVASATPNPLNVEINDQNPSLLADYYDASNTYLGTFPIVNMPFAEQFYTAYTSGSGSFTPFGNHGAPSVIAYTKQPSHTAVYGLAHKAIYHYEIPLRILQTGGGLSYSVTAISPTHTITF